jgi:hypothetical protein
MRYEIVKKIREIWGNEARNIGILNCNEDNETKLPIIPISIIPKKFKTYSLQELRQDKLLGELIRVYQIIFGTPDIWNEGAFCNREGWARTISLEEYERRKKEGKLRCYCGGIFQSCYPTEILETRILDELSDSKRSILAIMRDDSNSKIAGFLWGINADFKEIGRRILNARYRERQKQGLIEISNLKHRLEKKGVLDNKFLYGDEMGLLKEFRRGLNYMYLIRLWCEHGYSQNVKQLLFWTSKKSPLYQLAFIYGCELLYTTSDGINFLFHPDFEPQLKVGQYYDEGEFTIFLKKFFKFLI